MKIKKSCFFFAFQKKFRSLINVYRWCENTVSALEVSATYKIPYENLTRNLFSGNDEPAYLVVRLLECPL